VPFFTIFALRTLLHSAWVTFGFFFRADRGDIARGIPYEIIREHGMKVGILSPFIIYLTFFNLPRPATAATTTTATA